MKTVSRKKAKIVSPVSVVEKGNENGGYFASSTIHGFAYWSSDRSKEKVVT